MHITNTSIIKYLLIIAGTISLLLGILGIFLPLLPTTPFLLLTAACFAKSSDKLYNKLIKHKIFGKYILNYRNKKAIPLKIKIFSISLLWLTIGYATLMILNNLWIKIFLLIIALAVTYHIVRLKTLKNV